MTSVTTKFAFRGKLGRNGFLWHPW